MVALAVGSVVGGSAFAGSWLRSKLTQVATDSGLQLTLDDVSVSPMGKVSVRGLVFKRADGSTVAAVQEAEASFSPWKVLLGRRRPTEVRAKTFTLDVLLQDGKPKEFLDLYKAARKLVPQRAKTNEDEADKKSQGGLALFVDGGTLQLRATGKGSQYLSRGLKIRDIRTSIDLAHGIGELQATCEGIVASKLSAKLEPKPDGPPRLVAAFVPEFRLAMPAEVHLPLGVDSVAVTGLRFDATEGGALDKVVLRKGETPLLQIGLVKPQGPGLAAQDISFTIPASALQTSAASDDKPARDKDKANEADKGAAKAPAGKEDSGPYIGTIASVAVSLEDASAAELALMARMKDCKVALPGDGGTAAIALVEVHTDRLPGEQPLLALTKMSVQDPTLDVPWREDAVLRLPGGKVLWQAVAAAELAKRKEAAMKAAEAELADELDDPNLPPGAKAKKLKEKAEQKLAEQEGGIDAPPGKAQLGKDGKPLAKKDAKKVTKKDAKKDKESGGKSWLAKQAPAAGETMDKLLKVETKVRKAMDLLAKTPRLDVQVKGGRVAFFRPGATTAFGGIQTLTVTGTPVLGDGSRSVEVSAEPFDDERVWGKLAAELRVAPGGALDKVTLSLAGGQFAQALRVVSSAVMVGADSDITAQLEIKTGAAEGSELKVTGGFSVKKVGIDWWRLAPRPIDNLTASGKLDVHISKTEQLMRFDFPELRLGEALLNANLSVTDVAKKPVVSLTVEMPKQDCGKALKSIPPSMITSMGSISAHGEMSWKMLLTVPLKDAYGSDLKLELDDTTCEIDEVTGYNLEEFTTGEWSRPVNENGVLIEQQVGPGSEAWTPLAELPRWTPWAMIATEDGNFYRHRGIAPGLVLRAIRLDLDYGRFVYGGSTITQQLVKNVFLNRGKNLARKFEELLIVWHLERNLQKLVPAEGSKEPANKRAKDLMVEMYVNMIEFGPNTYGITRAAQTYFGKDPRDLTPLESAFLAANKPCPSCGYRVFKTKGEGKDPWPNWWVSRMAGILTKMDNHYCKNAVAPAPDSECALVRAKIQEELGMRPAFVGWPARVPIAPVEEDTTDAPGVEGGEEQ